MIDLSRTVIGNMVLVCGGRKFVDQVWLWHKLDEIDGQSRIDVVIEGGYTGADECAREWAEARQRISIVHRARWSEHGNLAGPMRNREMLLWKPDLVVAFRCGRGTDHMVLTAQRANIPIMDFRHPETARPSHE